MIPGSTGTRLRFGDCILDTSSRELRRHGEPQGLSPKALQFLQLLIEARPRALAKQEIRERLWPETFVADSSLARLASEVRAAIGDDARHPQFLRTVHRHGYSFSGPVAAEPLGLPPAAAPCRLLWGEREIGLREGENLVGRAAEATVRIDLGRISRLHARIVVSGGRAVLEDLGSTNGTFLCGERLRVLLFRATGSDSTTETGTAR
jgi:DNA-binding winged helix-turn-helix (wHTH) protein